MALATATLLVPTTVKGGSKKSATPDPSRRNSGHMRCRMQLRRARASARWPAPPGRRRAGRHSATNDDAVEVLGRRRVP